MAKDCYYFSHDSNARHDPKILKLRAKYGIEGYGLYWFLIEVMREQENHCIKENDIDALAVDTQCERINLKEYIEFCIEIGLLSKDKSKIFSKSLRKRMKIYKDKSSKARKSALKRWENTPNTDNANAMRTHSEGNALKESKVKESKVKEITYQAKDFRIQQCTNFTALLTYLKKIPLDDTKRKDIEIAVMSANKGGATISQLHELVEASLPVVKVNPMDAILERAGADR